MKTRKDFVPRSCSYCENYQGEGIGSLTRSFKNAFNDVFFYAFYNKITVGYQTSLSNYLKPVAKT